MSLYKIFAIFLLVLSLTAWGETIKMGYFSLEPHSFINSQGKAEGLGVTYINDLAEKVGDKVEWIGPLPFPRLIEELKNGKIDGAMPLSHTQERELFFDFLEPPLFMGQQVLYVRKNHPLKEITKLEEIKNWHIGFLNGAKPGALEGRKDLAIEWESTSGSKWIEQNILKLKNNHLDAIYDKNAYTLVANAKRLKLSDEFKILTLPVPRENLYLVFSKMSRNKKLVERYFKAQKMSPSYQHFMDNFLAK